MGVQERDTLAQLSLPPGFRFYPTDEELLVQYLCKKVAGQEFSMQIIAEVDLYKFDPWLLPSKATFGEKEWYFFSPRDRKYPNGSRPNRVAGSGYWKATGTDKIIFTDGRKVGIKKALVFYVGKAPKGTKTNWIMHEYRLSMPPKKTGSAKLDDWVLCRIYKKNSSVQKPIYDDGQHMKEHSHVSSSSSSSQLDNMLESLPEIDGQCFSMPRMNSLRNFHQEDQKLNLQSLNSGSFDWATLAGFNSVPELGSQPVQTQLHMNNTIINNNNNNNNNMNHQNNMFTPTAPRFIQGGVVDEEVESGMRTQRVDNSGLVFNSNAFTQSLPNALDPFVTRYPNQPSNLGFRQ